MNKYLYPCFEHWCENNAQVFFYSDPHFDDAQAMEFKKDGITSEEQIKRINSKVGKTDTIVFLGDINNIEWIKKIRAKRKILILGNHDKGVTNYLRKIDKMYLPTDLIYDSKNNFDLGKFFLNEYELKSEIINNNKVLYLESDNKLFDEVYTGCLLINKKILLSHEPTNFEFAFNIHGHDHSGKDFINHVLKYYDADMSVKDYTKNYLNTIKLDNLKRLNVCCEWHNYYPVSLKEIIDSGVLKDIPDIHQTYRDSINSVNEQ